MSHPLRRLRHLIAAILDEATFSVLVGDGYRKVNILREPPENGWQNDDALPGIYGFVKSENIQPHTYQTDLRDIEFELVIQAMGGLGDSINQLDEIQLLAERVLIADQRLRDLCMSFRPVSSRIRISQGEVVFASRIVTFSAQIPIDRSDPDID